MIQCLPALVRIAQASATGKFLPGAEVALRVPLVLLIVLVFAGLRSLVLLGWKALPPCHRPGRDDCEGFYGQL